MEMDFVLNGQGHGSVASILVQNNMDVRALRPWLGDDGRPYVDVVRNGKIVPQLTNNTNTVLRKDEWKLLDDAVIKAAMDRLGAVADLRSRGLTRTIPNGMGKTILEYEKQGDINEATISMDGLKEGQADRPEYTLAGLPLPIVHKDWHFSARQLATSRNGSMPLDTTMAELAGRKVAEFLEEMLLGASAYEYSYGGYTIQGYRTMTNRLTKTFTSPTSGGWIPATLVAEFLSAKTQLATNLHYGPFMVYVAPAWDQYLDDDFSAAKGDLTLRERLLKINGIVGIKTLDRLDNYDILFVELNRDVVQWVIGQEITTVQWEALGGMRIHYKVLTIQVPMLRTDINNRTGILHGSV
jgi:uncharacterized linocin/CFP29 family protein